MAIILDDGVNVMAAGYPPYDPIPSSGGDDDGGLLDDVTDPLQPLLNGADPSPPPVTPPTPPPAPPIPPTPPRPVREEQPAEDDGPAAEPTDDPDTEDEHPDGVAVEED